jgi:hypothetical protein
MIASGTVWIFATLAALTVIQLLLSLRISGNRKDPAEPLPPDAIEAT